MLNQVVTLNDVFRPVGIQFVHRWQLLTNSAFRELGPDPELAASQARELRHQHGTDQTARMNIFVTLVGDTGFGGQAVFPWLSNSLGRLVTLGPGGSVVVNSLRFGSDEVALVHEIGHALGLYHTYRGSSAKEVTPCTACWESAEGGDPDRTGDFCSDTTPAPITDSGMPGPSWDECSKTDWPPGERNYMSHYPYAGGGFTSQQARRMHAWIEYALTGWLDVDTPTGPSGLAVEANAFGGITMHWTDHAWNETGFVVERTGPDGAPTTTPLPANTTSFEDLKTAPLTRYGYRVWAVNGAINSYPSLTVAARTRADPRILCVIPDMAEPPGDWMCDELFPAVREAYEAAAAAAPTIMRIQAGEYREVLRFEKLLRLEAVGGPVLIGIP